MRSKYYTILRYEYDINSITYLLVMTKSNNNNFFVKEFAVQLKMECQAHVTGKQPK